MSLAATDILTAVSALTGVLGLIWLGARLARAGGWGRMPDGGRILAVEEALPLGGRQKLLLVRCGGRRAVLLTGGATDLMLGWLEETP
jgi:flagellar protein FliO/FliZ